MSNSASPPTLAIYSNLITPTIINLLLTLLAHRQYALL